MEPLIIEGTEFSPQVTFDPSIPLFEIKGESRPEHAGRFFKPILSWLEEFREKLPQKEHSELTLEVKLQYFNSTSAKFIYDIIKFWEGIHQNGCRARVLWHYDERDEDLKDSGEEFQKIVDIPFELKSF